MDATATYADIVAIESWHDRRLWLRLRVLLSDDTTGSPPPILRRGPNGRDALLIARYRLVSRLAAAEQLAEQWQREPAADGRNKRRDAEHEALRNRLRVWMRSYVRAYATKEQTDVSAHRAADPSAPAADLMTLLERASRSDFRHFLQFVALYEADCLIDDYRWSRGRRRPGMAVSQTGLNLLRPWSRLYSELAAHRRAPSADVNWPPDPRRLDVQIARYLALKPSWARGWTEYYNAACTVAVALIGERDERRRKTLALQAVRHLERAVSSTDSGYVGRHAQWLSTGDPDLNSLRGTDEFVDFLDRYLPNPDPRIPRPDDLLLRLVMSHHTLRLLESFAEQRAMVLRRSMATSAGVTGEREKERQVLQAAAAYAADDRHWQTRVALIMLADQSDDVPGLRTDLPRFQDDPEVKAVADRMAVGWSPQESIAHFQAVIERRELAWSEIERRIEKHQTGVGRGSDAVRFWIELAGIVQSARSPAGTTSV